MQWITFNFTSPALAGNCTDCNMFFYRSKWCNIAMLLFLLSSSSLIRQMLKRGVVNQNYRKEPTCQLCHIFFISSKHTCRPSHVIFKYTLVLWSLFLIHLLIDFHVSHFGSCRIISKQFSGRPTGHDLAEITESCASSHTILSPTVQQFTSSTTN